MDPLISELRAPIDRNEFLSKIYRREPFSVPSGAVAFRHLIDWPLIGAIIESGHPDCWLPKDSRLPKDESRMTLESALEGFEQGRTVLVRHSERAHPEMARIAATFHEVLQKPIDIQLYCTPRSQVGFGWHYDVEQVFVIQSRGQKEFLLRRNSVNPLPGLGPLPQNLRFDLETAKTQYRCLLQEGDWLHIPAGFWHHAQAVEDSFHLSVGVLDPLPKL
ncbi:MAG: hypothetical protein EBX52_13725 [Proteobacteria bacterium]|nr:hypothetical protein [Pseudomonadota bacterium]